MQYKGDIIHTYIHTYIYNTKKNNLYISIYVIKKNKKTDLKKIVVGKKYFYKLIKISEKMLNITKLLIRKEINLFF